MTATLTPTPKQQFFDANGNPLVGGKLYSYSAGTTSPVVTYVDSAGVTTNTNPIILDSRGEANVWLGTGTFKFKLVSATDVEIWTVDNIPGAPAANAALVALAASDGSSLVGYLPAGTGAVATTVQTKLRESVSVKDFGAVGDGVTDDTAAIQAAIDSSEGSVYFPSGVYNINATITNNSASPRHIVGAGIGTNASGVQVVATTDADVFSFTGGGAVTINDITLTSSVAMSGGIALKVVGDNSNKLSLTAERLYIGGTSASNDFKKGIYLDNCNDVRIDKCLIVGKSASSSTMNAVEITSSAGTATVYNITNMAVYNCDQGVAINNTHDLGVEGVRILHSDIVGVRVGVVFTDSSTYMPPLLLVGNCHINAKEYGIYAQGISQFFVHDCDIYMSGVASTAIHSQAVSPSMIHHNQIHVIDSGDCTGINLIGPSTGDNVTDNYLNLKSGTTLNGINLGSGIAGAEVKRNYAVNAVYCVSDGSSASNINYVDSNFVDGHLDNAYVNPTIASTGGVIPVQKVKFNGYATLTDSGTTITGLTGSNGQQITICCNNAVTFQHNAGLLLKGGVNFSASAGSVITLYKEASAWREIPNR